MKGSVRAWVRTIAVVLVALVVVGCSGGSGYPQGDSAGAPPAPAGGGPRPEAGGDGGQPEGEPQADQDRLIIRSKTLRLEVESTTDTITKLRDAARSHGGHVSDLEVATDSDDWVYRTDGDGYPVGDGQNLRGWVTMRVPTDKFEAFVDEVSGFGTVKFQSEASDDVTQQHVDLSARLDNLRAQEERLREFFEAADDVEDMLAIEKELGRVRGEIESLDAQVTYLERQAAMATVTVELVEPREVVRPDGESWGFVQAITDGVRGAAGVLTSIITFVIATSPLWIVALVLYFPIRGLVRRRRARKEGLPPTGQAPDSDETV